MPHRFQGERTLMRIFIGERDSYEGQSLYNALVQFFRKRGLPGATVLRGITGFGAHARLHTTRIEVLSLDLPIVIEVTAREEEIQAVLPELDRMIDGGLVTLERVRVILYRPHDVPENERWQHRIAGLDPDSAPERPNPH